MRTLDPGFAAHIATGQTTLATCWRIARADGEVLGFTDHDVALNFDGTDFEPAHGLDGSETTAKLGPQIDTSEVTGVIHAEAVTEDDILLGRYDGALVETWRVNWRDVSQRFLQRRDTIGEIVREDGIFRVELRSAQHALNVASGRVYQPLCDAELGDARCGVDLENAAYKASGTVDAVADRFGIVVSGLSGFDAGWFSSGTAEWTAGRRDGKTDRIVAHARSGSDNVLRFDAPVGDWVVAGDTLIARAGCDRRLTTCRERFANTDNFRGFPHIPGNDFALQLPKEGDRLTGGPLVE